MEMEDEEEVKPHRCTTIVYYAWKIFTCLFTHVMLVTAVVAYCILGAYTFEHLERDHEIKVKKNVTNIRKNVTEDLWILTRDSLVLHQDNWTSSVVNRLKIFENELVMAMRYRGWDGSEDVHSLQWTFHGALFYSIIVITTIGYGHIAPKTDFGKVTTIFYAIMGIPLMLLCLSNIGDIMANSFRFLYWRICCYACTQPPKRSHSAHRRGRSVRSTVRSHGSGARTSGRSRTSSGRRGASGATQRLADSALALSDIAHSYSDTDCRYYEDLPDEATPPRRQGSSLKRTIPPSPLAKPQPGYSQTWHGKQPPPKNNILDNDDGHGTPVLFNKYALDREDSCRVHPKKEQPRVATRGQSAVPELSRAGRSQTVEPSDLDSRQYLTVDTPIQRSSSLRHSRQGRRPPHNYNRGRGSHHRHPHLRENLDYDFDYYYDHMEDNTSNVIKPVPIWLCVFLVISYIIGGAFLFAGWEGWGYADSAYFCFITLTTIGFGDYVPAQRVRTDAEVSIALCSLYLLFGIALLAMSFNLVQEEVISNVKSVARNLGILKDESDEDDDY